MLPLRKQDTNYYGTPNKGTFSVDFIHITLFSDIFTVMEPPVLSDPLKDSWWPYMIAIVVGLVTCIKSYMGGQDCPSKQTIHGKTVIITGASSGIGYETALELAKRGATIILACRNMESGRNAISQIKKEVKNAKLLVKELDLASLQSIHKFIKALEFKTIDILINNAGIAFHPFKKTSDGFEMHLVSNYLGHFLLTHLLLPKLKASSKARIINMSAHSHLSADINLDDLNRESNYTPREAFAQSKLALLLMTHHMAKILKGIENNMMTLHVKLNY
ncbi:hypothetical protein C0J52_17973 [Blattella germanica]|nr:hypothetical protein C0J52_17973 [Blattella germanica]